MNEESTQYKEHIIEVKNLNFFYGTLQALIDISIDVPIQEVTAFIGPSGCGKSTLLRLFNRMNDVVDNTRIEGQILIEGQDIYNDDISLELLREKVGMVFQKANPFPMSIFQNVVFGPKMSGVRDKSQLEEIAELSLKKADLWNEVKDLLNKSALDLSGGQQQRLCIARTLANEPQIILMDEPTSALDPISTGRIEETISELAADYTILIVTHNMQQAARISNQTALLWIGKLIEYDRTDVIFTNPREQITEDYITGRTG